MDAMIFILIRILQLHQLYVNGTGKQKEFVSRSFREGAKT
jgi:hypothetical protein